MTREELLTMCGSNDQTDYAIQLVLKNVKREFVVMCIKAELSEIQEEIDRLVGKGIICQVNGSYQVDWGVPERVYGDEPGAAWKATEEQDAEHDRLQELCVTAQTVLWRRNRTIDLIAVR